MLARSAAFLAVLCGLTVATQASTASSTLLATAVVAAAIAVWFTGQLNQLDTATGRTAAGGPLRSDERCRRGAFRRQSHPTTPGRPLPRAPQAA